VGKVGTPLTCSTARQTRCGLVAHEKASSSGLGARLFPRPGERALPCRPDGAGCLNCNARPACTGSGDGCRKLTSTPADRFTALIAAVRCDQGLIV